MGVSVAIDGDTAVVGAPQSAGQPREAAYVFVRNGATWVQQAELLPSNPNDHTNFARSVDISGDIIVVGAYQDDGQAGSSQGAVYIFIRNGGVWSQDIKLTASDGQGGDSLGYSVAIDGNTVVAGASGVDTLSMPEVGAAYVFKRIGEFWSEEAKITPGDGAASDLFGTSVDVYGDSAVIGSHQHEVGGQASQGAAYVYVRSGATWAFESKLTAADGAAFDRFGSAVAMFGDTAVIGAAEVDGPAGQNAGSAYVFTRSGIVWGQQAKLTASDAQQADQFGDAVAISGDIIVVGAPGADGQGGVSQGAAYVFERSGVLWVEQAKLSASVPAQLEELGLSVALTADTLLTGAPGSGIGGASYVFRFCMPQPGTCIGDMDASGLVDVNDIPPFVQVLLNGAVDSRDLCLANLNGDGTINGLDMQPFIDMVMSGGACN
jgi:hypothetical protein